MNGLPFADLFAPDSLFRNAVLGGLLVTTLCAALGVYVVLRRIVLAGIALPQAAAAGVALVFWLTGHGAGSADPGHAMARVGALVATFAALAFLLPRGDDGGTPVEWRMGALLAVSMATTILFVALNPRGDLELTGLLRGDLLAIADNDLRTLFVVSFVTAVLFVWFWRPLLLTSFDPEYARTLGFSPLRYDALLYVLLGAGVGLGVMTAGPLVVFGFLVLPPLAALRVATGIGAAFGVSMTVAAASSLGGFALAYRADLPAGPTSVAVAAVAGGSIALGASLWRRWRRATQVSVALLAGLLLGLGGCATGTEPAGPLDRGTLPPVAPERAVAVLRVHDATGEHLRIPSPNPLTELGRAAGDPFLGRGETVPDRLQRMTATALARRGVAVEPPEDTRRLVPEAPANAAAAAALARRAGIPGPVLQSTLRRFTRTGSDLLLVQLELQLVDPADGRVLWVGHARGPYSVKGSFTLEETLRDVSDRLFAEVFGGA